MMKSATVSSTRLKNQPALLVVHVTGMFTANSMNCLTEALGLSLPGNGTIVATHLNRIGLFEKPQD